MKILYFPLSTTVDVFECSSTLIVRKIPNCFCSRCIIYALLSLRPVNPLSNQYMSICRFKTYFSAFVCLMLMVMMMSAHVDDAPKTKINLFNFGRNKWLYIARDSRRWLPRRKYPTTFGTINVIARLLSVLVRLVRHVRQPKKSLDLN